MTVRWPWDRLLEPGDTASTPAWMTTDAIAGALAVLVAAGAGYAYVLSFITIDDGLETLIVLPLSACTVGLVAGVRSWLADRGTELAVATRVWFASVATWGVLGLVLSLFVSPPRLAMIPGLAISLAMGGGTFTLIGTCVGAGPVVALRRLRRSGPSS